MSKLDEARAKRAEMQALIEERRQGLERKLNVTSKLAFHIASTCIGLVLVSVLVLTQFSVSSANGAIDSTLKENIQASAVLGADVVQNHLNTIEQEALALAKNPYMSDGNIPITTKIGLVMEYQDMMGFVGQYGWTDSNPAACSIDISGTEAYNRAYQDKTTWIAPFYNSEGKLVFRLVVPVHNTFMAQYGSDYEDIIDGGMVFDFDYNDLTELIKNTVVGDNGNSYMIDNNDVTIASTANIQAVEAQASSLKDSSAPDGIREMEKKMVAGETGNTSFEFDGTSWIAGYAPVGTTGWSLCLLANPDDFNQGIKKMNKIIYLLSFLAILTAFVLGLFQARRISGPVEELSEASKKLADGDFDVEIVKHPNSEVGILAESFEATIANLQAITNDISRVTNSMKQKDFDVYIETPYVGEFETIEESLESMAIAISDSLSSIKEVGLEVNNGASQVASSSQTLAQGATEQASAVEELSATIKDIYEQTQANTQNARIAAEKVDKAGQEITSGNEQMNQLMMAMEDMTNKSNEIQKIVKTIEDIAFQTNILALNAAVEAARAGAAGKGFAVVADEVRNLATKSSEAASSTTKLIEETIDAISNGNKIASSTADALGNVVEITKEAVSKVNEISAASEEQASAVSQVTLGIEQISQVVATNSATAEESAAASEELTMQVEKLNRLIEEYNLRQF